MHYLVVMLIMILFQICVTETVHASPVPESTTVRSQFL